MLRLEPPTHLIPDNFWHTLMIGLVSSFFIWHCGQEVIELYLNDAPVTPVEQRLLDGEGHPLQVGISALAGEEYALLANRILAGIGWLFSLVYIARALKPLHGFLGGLPSWLLLFTLPGFSVWMCSAGSGSWGIFFFLMAFYTVNGHETKAPLIRGGVMAGLAVLIHPLWFLPALGVLVGCFEAFRYRLKWVALGFGAALLTGGLLMLVLAPGGLGYLIAGPGFSSPGEWETGTLLLRYLLLILNVLLLVVYGALRRGVGWWTLVLTLPLLLLEPILASGMETVLIPLWVFSALGLSKLPALLDVRFPRVYQTVLLCQLLLWLPVYLNTQPLMIYPPLP